MQTTAASPRPLVPSDLKGAAATALQRAAYALALSVVRGEDAERIAQQRWPHDGDAALAIVRSAVSGATTGTPGWAAELVASATGRFFAGLTPPSAMGAVIARGIQVRLDGTVALAVPYLSTRICCIGGKGRAARRLRAAQAVRP